MREDEGEDSEVPRQETEGVMRLTGDRPFTEHVEKPVGPQ
jgi:hypothetical protein